MMKFLPTLILLLLISLLSAQTQHHQKSEPQDTTLSLLRMTDPSVMLERPVFVLPLMFALAHAQDAPLPSLYQSFAGTPQSFNWDHPSTIDLTAPLKLQLQDAEKDRPWKITLGAAELGGAAYIAYKHIKKYGFK